MRRRLFDLCLLLLPARRRAADSEMLRDLAMDLSQTQGAARQAMSLLRLGIAEQWQVLTRRRSVKYVTAAALAACALTLGLIALPAAAGERVQVEEYSCAVEGAQCDEVLEQVRFLERSGWSCGETTAGAGEELSWRCTL